VARQTAAAARWRQALAERLPDGAVLACDGHGVEKLLGPDNGRLRLTPLQALAPAAWPAVAARARAEGRPTFALLHDRAESAAWRARSAANAALAAPAVAGRAPLLELSRGGERLRLWRL
jgi:hypothetical protein